MNGIETFDRRKLSLIVLSKVLDRLIFGRSKGITVAMPPNMYLRLIVDFCCLDFVLTSPKNYLDRLISIHKRFYKQRTNPLVHCCQQMHELLLENTSWGQVWNPPPLP